MATDLIARGIAANKADLVNGKVPSDQLPSYVDDVIEVATYDDLPNPGETGKIYVTLDSNKTYRWTGSVYVIVGAGQTYAPFPGGALSGTLQAVVTAIMNFPNKAAGMAYLGSIEGECTPFGYGNAECTVTFVTSSIAILSVSSSNVAPYHWEYNTAQNDYQWRSFCVLPATPTYSASKTYHLTLTPDIQSGTWSLSWEETITPAAGYQALNVTKNDAE